MLSPYRVLDLTDERGMICGEILADLGADVIAIEPPDGNRARRIGPFAGDEEGPERSLYWTAYARNKRSVVLDLESEQGRDDLKRLVAGADFLIESFDPGYMDSLGLGHEALEQFNPGLVYVSISAFGQDGPKAGYAATDITVMAAAGPMAMTGDDDRAPLRYAVPQAFLHGGAQAAGAALIAHRERLRSGRGQHVDVSAQQSTAQATQSTILAVPVGDQQTTRKTRGIAFGPLLVPLVWDAADGYVSITFLFGTIGPFSRRLMEWVHEEGFCDEATRDKDWLNYTTLLLSGEESPEEYQRVLGTIADFARTKTKQELLDGALERRLLIAPMTTIEDLDGSEQFAARDYWRDSEDARLGRTVRHPGAFAKLSATPIEHRRGAPSIGEHNSEVLSIPRELAAIPAPAGGDGSNGAGLGALSDLKVLDLMWVVAGPASTRIFADYGATVVKIESTSRVDTSRGLGPNQNGEPGPEQSVLYQNMNAGKLGMTLDLGSEEGRAVFRDLVRWADVVCESFSPKAMPAWGLDYESLKAIKPDLIMLSSCLFGQSGPLSGLAGFGTMGAAIAGFNSVAGWPDRAPAMVAAYSDYVAPWFTIATVLAAVDHRDRTGDGQYIDLSQAEAAIHFLAPAVLDYSVNGRVAGPIGNVDPQLSPHGVYPAAGDDRWIAIAARDDADWTAIVEVIGSADLASDDRFATIEGRLDHREALDEAMAAWTATLDEGEIEATLQAHDVPAHVVQNSAECFRDPQLLHRGHFVELEHELLGTTTVEGSRFRLSRTPARIERSAPTFGRDNMHVLTEILGYDGDRVAEVAAAEVLA